MLGTQKYYGISGSGYGKESERSKMTIPKTVELRKHEFGILHLSIRLAPKGTLISNLIRNNKN